MHRFFYNSIANPQYYKTALIACDLEKLDLFGDEYLFEWLKQYGAERQYRSYITDCLKMICENTSKLAGGSAPSKRYFDMIEPKKPEETRNADEIIADLNKKCGLTMIDDTGGEPNECECI